MVNLTHDYVDTDKQLIYTPEKFLRWSSVSLSEVQNKNLRLDATVFDIEGKYAREVLKICKWDVADLCGENGLADAYHRPRFKRIFVENSDLPIYQPSQINEIYPSPHLYISKLTDTDIGSLRVKKDQILLTCSGTIGNVSIVNKTLKDCIFSHDLIRIKAKNEDDTGYIYAFLKTEIGNTLVNTNNYGAVIKHIEPEHLQDVPIPNPEPSIKKQIHQLIMDSFNLRDQSNDLVDEAQNLLKSELQLPPLNDFKSQYFDENASIRNYQVKLSQFEGRLDASYHVPIVDAILDHIKKYAEEVTTLGDSKISRDVILPGRFKRIYVESGQGIVFFGGKQIYELDPSNKKYLSPSKHKNQIDGELKLRKNMILITRSGTIGKINITPIHWENWIINEHVIRVIPSDEKLAGYIFTWLSSEYGYELITRFTYGAVVDEIDDKHVAQVQIPILKNKDIQQKINDLVLDANQKRYEAYLLEQEALKIINDSVIYAE